MNGRRGGRQIPWMPILLVLVLFGLASTRRLAVWVLDLEWWKEAGQIDTYWETVLYSVVPMLAVALIGFVVLWVAHARAMKKAGTGLGSYPLYGRLATLGLLVLGYLLASGTVDNWTAVLYLGGQKLPPQAGTWADPVFQHPLTFYLFQLPFYQMLLRVVLAFSVVTGLVYAAALMFWTLKERTPRLLEDGAVELRDIDFGPVVKSKLLRLLAIVFLIAFATDRFLDRYELLTADHGFMVGIDYVDDNVRLPLRWLTILGCVAAMGLVSMGKWRISVIGLVLVGVAESAIPRVVHSLYVRPNEISLEKPYIQRHIAATRAAFGLDKRTREVEYRTRPDARADLSKHTAALENVRLWDWRAFHDTVTQIQALRPYYVFQDTDVDRYVIDGKLQQVMLTPRELDVRQLTPDARGRWMNPHFIYTHGYGVVLAEANRITADGLPMLFIQNAPLEVKTKSLKVTRPELYYGEVTHEPVFVRTGQPEFNYPSGAENVHTRYEGKGGFPITSLPLRLAATLAYADWNISLTGFLTPESRMMIRRDVSGRISELAGFVRWDPDPYLVISRDGRLVWMVDGYTTADSHPYAAKVRLPGTGRVNYVRNSVKATVDAYDGDVKLYIFDEADPVIQAYAALFPKLFRKASEMPADLREHVRYPEALFRVQAEIYRSFHMRDPEAFYNKEDLWDIPRYLSSQEGKPEPLTPTYVVATLPGEQKPEFLLLIPFTPRNKDNLIGFMAARCDGDKLGELMFLQLSKQELIFGPLQIEARINQDQTISKDLSLWNQQGSRVLRGQMLVLPIDNAFVYVVPIYIQANEARMPQLKKVVVATGNTLAYADTYEQALAQLGAGQRASSAPTVIETQAPTPGGMSLPPPAPGAAPSDSELRLDRIRRHMQRYKELASQGKWAEAGRELEALEAAARR